MSINKVKFPVLLNFECKGNEAEFLRDVEYEFSDAEASYACGSLFGAGSGKLYLRIVIFLGNPLIDHGADTTTSAISIAIMAATLYPSAAMKAREELDRVIGRDRRNSHFPPNASFSLIIALLSSKLL